MFQVSGPPLDSWVYQPPISSLLGKRRYTPEQLEAAINDVLLGNISGNQAAKKYGIPQKTLSRHVIKARTTNTTNITVPSLPPPSSLSSFPESDATKTPLLSQMAFPENSSVSPLQSQNSASNILASLAILSSSASNSSQLPDTGSPSLDNENLQTETQTASGVRDKDVRDEHIIKYQDMREEVEKILRSKSPS